MQKIQYFSYAISILLLGGCNLSIDNAGGGTVTSSDNNLHCGTICQFNYNTTQTVTLSATSEPGYIFDRWSGACTGSEECTVTIGQTSGHKNVKVHFVPARSLALGGWHSCALENGDVTCWGADNRDTAEGQTLVPDNLANPTAISTGWERTCVIDDNGVQCWGRSNEENATPTNLVNPTSVVEGVYNTCAIDDAGVQCWGDDYSGQSTVPESLSNPTAIKAGLYHMCAWDDNGVTCWGNNNSAQSTVPTELIATEAN